MTISSGQAALAEGWLCIPLTRGEASFVLGREIPEDAWGQIRLAFMRYGAALTEREGLRDVRGKSNKQSFHRAKEAALSSLDNGISSIISAGGERGLLNCFAYSERQILTDKLSSVFWELIDIRQMVDSIAAPGCSKVGRISSLEKALARDLYNALNRAGLRVRLTHGSCRHSGMQENELTPFEILLRSLKIRPDVQPSTFAEWLRRDFFGTDEKGEITGAGLP